MDVIRTFEDAFAVGRECLSKINTTKQRPRLMDNYLLPLNIDDGPWAMTEEALYQTLSYIMNFLNHSCYMLCVTGDDQKMFKLETQTMSPFFQEILEKEVRIKQDAKINDALLNNGRLKPLRIMQCVVKPFAIESATSKEYEELFTKIRAPDGVYILNLTDAMILRKNGLIPWKLNKNVKLPREYQMIEKFIPVLSISGENGYWDIPIPNYDDVQYVLKTDHPDPKFETDWGKKKSKAVFRGGPTGCGVSEETNMRIKLAKMGLDSKYAEYLDVGIVVKNPKAPYIDSDAIRFDPKVGLAYMNTYIKPVARMSMSEQSKFKYIIHIDGNVHAYRLLTTMQTGSLILRVKSDYTSWVDHLLDDEEKKGNRLYISVRPDMSDLIDQIKFCETHDDECRRMAKSAADFSKTAMTSAYVINAIESVMWKLKDLLKSSLSVSSSEISLKEQEQQRYAIVGEGENATYYSQGKIDKKWHSDSLIQSVMKMNVRNSNDILCVLQDMCFSSSFNEDDKKTLVDGEECVSEDMAINRITTDLFKQFYHYFDNAYFLSQAEMKASISKKLDYSNYVYPILEHMERAAKLMYNQSRYNLGKTANIVDIPDSPIQDMVDLILTDKDESRKRRLIITLVDSQKYVYPGLNSEESIIYTGENESEWWYYCVQTHVKLIPAFEYILATAVLNHPREYDAIRSNLIQNIGEQIDDGIYDKHTGVFIEPIKYITEEGFDDSGFKLQTRAVLENDEDDTTDEFIGENLDNEMDKIVFEDFEDVEAVGLDDDDDDDVAEKEEKTDSMDVDTSGNQILDVLNRLTFHLKFTPAIIETFYILLNELVEQLNNAYDQYLVNKKNAKGKEGKEENILEMGEYVDIQTTNYVLIIYIYMVELFLSKKKIIQKIADSSGKSVLDEYKDDSDLTALLTRFISHIMMNQKKNKSIPKIYKKMIKNTATIGNFINTKRGDVIKNPMIGNMKQTIETELSSQYVGITKSVIPQTVWNNFLPVQNPQDLIDIRACAELQTIGTAKKTDTFLFGKMVFLSFCIQRTIQEILNSDKYRDSLMMNIKIYNQMNSCCIERITNEHTSSDFGSTLEFFNENSPNENLIERYNKLIQTIESKLLASRSITRSFLSNVDTQIPYPVISQALNEIVMEDGIKFLSSLKLIPASASVRPDENLKNQFMLDYLKFSQETLQSPVKFSETKLPLIQLIQILKKDKDKTEEKKEEKDELEKMGDWLYSLYEKNGREYDSDEILEDIQKLTANKLKKMDQPNKTKLERAFALFYIPESTESEDKTKDTELPITQMNNIYSGFAFLRNYLVLICNVFPMLFKDGSANFSLLKDGVNGSFKSKNKKSSWFDFSDQHWATLANKISADYETMPVFDSPIVQLHLKNIMKQTEKIMHLSSTTYFQPSSSASNRDLLKITLALFEFYIASVFEIYSDSVNQIQTIQDLDEDDEDDYDKIKELIAAKKQMLDFSIQYFEKTAKKDVADSTFKKIMDMVFKHKENEKNKFRHRLEKMLPHEKLAYMEERKVGMGEYNVKNYAGLKKYDAKFYDKTQTDRQALDELENHVDEEQAELMASNHGDEDGNEDGDYNNVFEDDGY